MDKRLNELESSLTLAEHLVDELNHVVTEQGQRISELEATVKEIQEQIAMYGGSSEGKHDKPPHY